MFASTLSGYFDLDTPYLLTASRVSGQAVLYDPFDLSIAAPGTTLYPNQVSLRQWISFELYTLVYAIKRLSSMCNK